MRLAAAITLAAFGFCATAYASEIVVYPPGYIATPQFPRLMRSPPCKALSIRDSASGMVFVVESDGRQVDAFGADGQLLWSHDPYAERHFKEVFYRHPCIVTLRLYSDKGGGIALEYNQGQFASLSAKTGDVTSQGRD